MEKKDVKLKNNQNSLFKKWFKILIFKKWFKILTFVVTAIIVLLIFLKRTNIFEVFQAIGGLIYEKALGPSLDTWKTIGMLSAIFITMILSFYLIRASYLDLDYAKKRSTRYISRFVYFVSNIFFVIFEVLMYGVLFMFVFYQSFPQKISNNTAAIELFGRPTIIGLIIMVMVYFICEAILKVIFKKIYGDFILLEERKWNRDGIDAIASALFIVSIVSSLVNLFVKDYKFTDTEVQLLFGVSVFSISLYVIKCIKSINITYLENKQK
ncbi:hypothetical protein [Bacillus sp. RIT 809]|uniref:hypothetical protein n=1 Tax=Bacillus sp. RIT 809 TaxID=2803857 RepID=UPI00194FC6F8|nr:hypothetical protein [Bacillus sp. RIT 809]MBM6648666.1 hypothetical protein [Bacillus sp. RIT 809]